MTTGTVKWFLSVGYRKHPLLGRIFWHIIVGYLEFSQRVGEAYPGWNRFRRCRRGDDGRPGPGGVSEGLQERQRGFELVWPLCYLRGCVQSKLKWA